MIIPYLLTALVSLLIAYGVYKLFKIKAKNYEMQQSLSEADLKPFLENLDLANEERVRKQWLISFFAFTAITAVSTLIIFFLDNEFTELSKSTNLTFSVVFSILIVFLLLVPITWITYHCCYNKRGTKWLILLLITIPMREIIDILRGEWYDAAEWGLLVWCGVITILGIEILFWINCERLRKVNATRKQQRALALKAKYAAAAN